MEGSESPVAASGASADAGPVSIRLEDVHVTYRVYEQRHLRLDDILEEGIKPRRYRSIHAVRGVTLDIHAGEAVGVVGSNGAGKSTLLRAISGLLPISDGAVYARSQPAFLGVGAALKPKLSGRQNIYIGGLVLGLSNKEIEERFDDIVRFAGLRRFIDLPMKAYSSGMRARLHFAIATAVTPEILLIDEALAVGDRKFRRRSARRVEEIRAGAGTVLLVSHGLDEIIRSCTRAVWLEQGRLVMDGTPEEIVEAYTKAEDASDDENDEAGAADVSDDGDAAGASGDASAGGVGAVEDREAARRRAKRARREQRRAAREQGV
ncbi:MAG: ATP-binding cassette domain-containing protein [Acidimicrobiia bacterium]|nr:ATP-binding cassette domain-containing protein [Acidimicrobiia bacterium]